jgi:hypothetical protein
MCLFTLKNVELNNNLIFMYIRIINVGFIKQQPIKYIILMKVFTACQKLQFYLRLSNDSTHLPYYHMNHIRIQSINCQYPRNIYIYIYTYVYIYINNE